MDPLLRHRVPLIGHVVLDSRIVQLLSVIQFFLDLPSGGRLENGGCLTFLLDLDKLPADPLHREVGPYVFMSLTLVLTRAWYLHRLALEPSFRRPEGLHGGRPCLAPANLSQVLIIILRTWYRFYAKNILWSPAQERSCIDSTILMCRSTVDILNKIVRAGAYRWACRLPSRIESRRR